MSGKFSPLYIVKQTNLSRSGTVIFFHGSGDTGRGIRDWVKILMRGDLKFPHLQIVYPTAPLRPYTPLNGEMSNVWFDRLDIRPDVPDRKESIDQIGKEMVEFIKQEISNNIPLNRIIIGGFSMGGGLSMHLAYRFLPDVAGLFCLSSFLGQNSLVYDELKSLSANDKRKQIPVFMCHGERDNLVPIEWGVNTYNSLKKYGISAEFHPLKNTLHELHKGEIEKLQQWILKVLPPLDGDL